MNTGQPPEKPTTKLSSEEIQRELLTKVLRSVEDGFARTDSRLDTVDARLDTMEQNVTILVDDKKTVNERLSRIETWKENEVTARLNANSIRVRSESDVNLKQDSAISQVIVKQGELVAKVEAVEANQAKAAEERATTAGYVKEVRDTIVGVATSPKTKTFASHMLFVGKVLFAVAAAYSAAHGLGVVP